MRDFHNTYYVPENADVDDRRRFRLGAGHAARHAVLRPGAEGRQAGAARHPEGAAADEERRAVVEEAWPLPAVVVAYHVTYDGHPDSYPLHMTSKILFDGESARIPRDLVYDKRIASTAFGSANILEDPNLFFAVASSGRSVPRDGGTSADRRVREAQDTAVPSHELERAKNQFVRDYIVGRETNEQKALHLAHAAVIHNDITRADAEIDIFEKLTTMDIQRVARTYFTQNNRTVLYIQPKGAGTGARR